MYECTYTFYRVLSYWLAYRIAFLAPQQWAPRLQKRALRPRVPRSDAAFFGTDPVSYDREHEQVAPAQQRGGAGTCSLNYHNARNKIAIEPRAQ